MTTRIVFDLGDRVRISPPLFTNAKLDVQPGDLTKFAPYGNGVYGYQKPKNSTPFANAPSQEPSGGTIYFGCDRKQKDFEAFLRLMEANSDRKDYAIFIAESKKPGKDGYIAQMRIVSKFALRFAFHAIDDKEYERFPEQQLTTAEMLWEFVDHERKRWGTSFTQDSEKGLEGMFGGDGDFAREELAFGFTVENEYYGIYRIWSRAWLVTK